MATLQKKGNGWYCQFLHRGKRYTFTVGQVSRAEAEAKAAQVDYLLMRLKQGLIAVPDGIDIADFLKHDGKPPAASTAPIGDPAVPSRVFGLSDLRDRYLETHRGSLEDRTLEGIGLHFKHLIAALGERFPVRDLKLADLQGYVTRRAKAKGTHGEPLSPATIRKELMTLRTVWNWGVKMGLTAGRFPNDGLRYPKADEKPPFMTRDEIERQVAAGDLSPRQKRELWEALYLRTAEVAELLALVRERASHPWIYPLIVMAAHTGARRSELIRMRVADVDLDAEVVSIRERKRVKGKRSSRRAPLTPLLREAVRQWLAVHPGGPILFCHAAEVERSKKRSRTTGHQSGKDRATTMAKRLATVRARADRPGHAPLTPKECHHHFRQTLSETAWSVVRGLHTLRHSFISACASRGIDQRLIDEWVGHTSEDMRRRYRHLYPSVQADAIRSVFG